MDYDRLRVITCNLRHLSAGGAPGVVTCGFSYFDLIVESEMR